MATKYDHLVYREIEDTQVGTESVPLRNEWLRFQIGRTTQVRRVPKSPMEPVFLLLGFGPTVFAAEEMIEQKLGRPKNE